MSNCEADAHNTHTQKNTKWTSRTWKCPKDKFPLQQTLTIFSMRLCFATMSSISFSMMTLFCDWLPFCLREMKSEFQLYLETLMKTKKKVNCPFWTEQQPNNCTPWSVHFIVLNTYILLLFLVRVHLFHYNNNNNNNNMIGTWHCHHHCRRFTQKLVYAANKKTFQCPLLHFFTCVASAAVTVFFACYSKRVSIHSMLLQQSHRWYYYIRVKDNEYELCKTSEKKEENTEMNTIKEV